MRTQTQIRPQRGTRSGGEGAREIQGDTCELPFDDGDSCLPPADPPRCAAGGRAPYRQYGSKTTPC
jgi:hypothetical protein